MNSAACQDHATRTAAMIAGSGITFMIATLIAFHFIQPELNPLAHFVSEYAVGRFGWLINVGFLAFASGVASLAAALHRSSHIGLQFRASEVLLVISAIGILASGIFNADLQGDRPTFHGIAHALAGLVAFFTIMPAMIMISHRLHSANRLEGIDKGSVPLAWAAPLLFIAMVAFFEPRGLVGLGQRLFLTVTFAWLVLLVHGIHAHAFRMSKHPIGGVEQVGASAPPGPDG